MAYRELTPSCSASFRSSDKRCEGEGGQGGHFLRCARPCCPFSRSMAGSKSCAVRMCDPSPPGAAAEVNKDGGVKNGKELEMPAALPHRPCVCGLLPA